MSRLVCFLLICLGLHAQDGKLVDIGGRKLHLHCAGAAGPAVVVAGAGYSFDWALVQPEVAKFARICTYDPAGFAWSDPGPGARCEDRVADLHKLLDAAGEQGPFILVGMSYGALVAREYAAEHPAAVAAVVLVDHAFIDPVQKPRPRGGPELILQTPIVLTMEDVSNFSKLPARSRELHRWADSLHPPVPSAEDARQCKPRGNLGDKPLVVVSTLNDDPNYLTLQKDLLALSTRSRQIIAKKSFHAVQIDEPEAVIEAIRAAGAH